MKQVVILDEIAVVTFHLEDNLRRQRVRVEMVDGRTRKSLSVIWLRPAFLRKVAAGHRKSTETMYNLLALRISLSRLPGGSFLTSPFTNYGGTTVD